MNLSATLNVSKLLYNPGLCKPKLVVDNFNQLPIPFNDKIKAIVLDKDNCFAYPKESEVWHEYHAKWQLLKKTYPGRALLIVSNSAGSSDDKNYEEAKILEQNTGVHVLRHSTKKPGCADEIIKYFREHNIIQQENEIAVVGDRLFTDIMMANMMNAFGIWIKDGVKPANNILNKVEMSFYRSFQSENKK